MVGYCDGTAIQTVDAKEPLVVKSTIGTSPEKVYAAGVREIDDARRSSKTIK